MLNEVVFGLNYYVVSMYSIRIYYENGEMLTYYYFFFLHQ